MYLNTFMEYYKFLDLNWQPVAEAMAAYIATKPELRGTRGAWVNCDLVDVLDKIPDLQKLFDPLNLHISRVSLFVMNYRTGKIHIDDDTNDYRINFPILNCKDTETRYYKTIGGPVKELQPNGVPYHFFNSKNCEQVDSFELNGAYIIKVHEPHQVVLNHNNFPRISCTIAFKENLENLFNSIR
jgi:hypothetical protein